MFVFHFPLFHFHLLMSYFLLLSPPLLFSFFLSHHPFSSRLSLSFFAFFLSRCDLMPMGLSLRLRWSGPQRKSPSPDGSPPTRSRSWNRLQPPALLLTTRYMEREGEGEGEDDGEREEREGERKRKIGRRRTNEDKCTKREIRKRVGE